MKLSSAAVIHFINGLFETNHPLESTVEYPNTETVSNKLRRLLSDMIVIIGGTHAYHIEAEIRNNENIVIRVFEYGFAEGLRTKTTSEDGRKISVKFPNARIIYWETTEEAPDEVTLSLEFPEGGNHEYKVKTFKFLSCGLEELEKRKLAILLPFYVLKLRKRASSARSARRLSELAAEMKAVMDELVAAAERAVEAGLLSEADGRAVLEYTEKLYRELYQDYEEFKEADAVLQDKILTYSEEAELKGMKKGREEGMEKGMKKGKVEVARSMLAEGLSFEIIQRCTGVKENELLASR